MLKNQKKRTHPRPTEFVIRSNIIENSEVTEITMSATPASTLLMIKKEGRIIHPKRLPLL